MDIKTKVATSVALLILTPATANAAGSQAFADRIVGFTVSAEQAAQGADYWTAERMAKAKPADLVVTSTIPSRPSGKGAKPPTGKPTVYPPAPGLEGWGGEAAVSGPSIQAVAVPRPYTNPPDRLNGKVYFAMHRADGTKVDDFVCSGTSVNSPGLSLVWTAGHCVHGGPGYSVHRNWRFVPAYSSSYLGEEPYDSWSAHKLWTWSGWAYQGDLSYDLGAVIVRRVEGRRLTERIGGQGIWFNASRFQIYSSFGYPAAPPFNGFDQYRCTSPVFAIDSPGPGPDTSGILCDMTGGSSGGGWLINLDANGWGYVNSVNSYKRSDPNIYYGPYHGDAGLELYNFVKDMTV